MPPKKKTPKSASSKPNTSDYEAIVQQLESRIKELETEVTNSIQERNFYQLDRDKINSFWEITKKELEVAQAELRNKEREMEELQESNQTKIMLFKQHSHHLAHEHQNNLTLLKKQQEEALRKLQEEHIKKEAELREEKTQLKAELRELKVAHENTTWTLVQDFDKNISTLRESTEQHIRQLQQKYDARLKEQREQLEDRFKNEMDELENTKNEHIQLLMTQHDEAFAGIKNYYTDITRNNVEMIKKYKAEVAKMKRSEAAQEKLMFEVCQDNKRMREPLQQVQTEVERLRQQVASHDKDKASLSSTKARLKDTEGQLKRLSWEHEVLLQKFTQLEKERDDLYNSFEDLVQQIQQKAGLRNLMLHKKVSVLSDELDRKETQLAEVLQVAAGNQVVSGSHLGQGEVQYNNSNVPQPLK
ncbi:hypothetical protein P9112_000870 [Eukaryota sp. TZLM1-RC]